MPSDFHDDVRVAIQISSLVMFIAIGNASNVNVAVPNENVHLFSADLFICAFHLAAGKPAHP
jgi:hypothetical protein